MIGLMEWTRRDYVSLPTTITGTEPLPMEVPSSVANLLSNTSNIRPYVVFSKAIVKTRQQPRSTASKFLCFIIISICETNSSTLLFAPRVVCFLPSRPPGRVRLELATLHHLSSVFHLTVVLGWVYLEMHLPS